MMKWKTTAEIKKIKGVEMGGGYQIWDIHILIKKNIKKRMFWFFTGSVFIWKMWSWFHVPIISAIIMRVKIIIMHEYIIFEVCFRISIFSKIGMHVTFTYSFVLLRRYLHWDSEMCWCIYLHIYFSYFI